MVTTSTIASLSELIEWHKSGAVAKVERRPAVPSSRNHRALADALALAQEGEAALRYTRGQEIAERLASALEETLETTPDISSMWEFVRGLAGRSTKIAIAQLTEDVLNRAQREGLFELLEISLEDARSIMQLVPRENVQIIQEGPQVIFQFENNRSVVLTPPKTGPSPIDVLCEQRSVALFEAGGASPIPFDQAFSSVPARLRKLALYAKRLKQDEGEILRAGNEPISGVVIAILVAIALFIAGAIVLGAFQCRVDSDITNDSAACIVGKILMFGALIVVLIALGAGGAKGGGGTKVWATGVGIKP